MSRKAVWEALVTEPAERVLPWLGGDVVHASDRSFRVSGAAPPEHGWWRFRVGGGQRAMLVGTEPEPMPDGFEAGFPALRGYVVGDRLVPDGARVSVDPDRLVAETQRLFLVERGLGRFARAAALVDRAGACVYVRQELPLGPEPEVEAAYHERRGSIDHIGGVTPALDLAFRWLSRERARAEAARERAAAVAAFGTGVERRVLAGVDFEAAARRALRLAGAELLDSRPASGRDEMVVVYRFRGLRLECVVSRLSLRVTDAGICLADHETGERGDDRFTLESLPGVVAQALDEERLVVFRHG